MFWKKWMLLTLVLVGVILVGSIVLAQEKPKLNIWGRASFAPAQAYWVNSVLYEWAQEKGIDVKITWIPVGDIAAKVVTAVASGTEPDMVIGGMPYT
ncbi:MAG: multiple sugar transport system substrate-binding protein, partial [Candidatus Atribacteria bacterium]|nr:multiple sugar transport system substrate-binding protein [Candidatus Atribacteria bacterium]